MNNIAVVEIKASRGIPSLRLGELWDYRELLLFFLWREIKGRYRQMALGPLWMLLQPLINMLLYTVVFGVVAKMPSDGLPYALFNYAALLPWTFFSSCLMSAALSYLSCRELISKIYFPKLIIPLVGVLSALVDFLLSFIILLGMMFYYGFTPTWTILWIPALLLVAAMTALSVGLWFAAWIVHFRDVAQVVSFMLRIWMFASPVVYSASMIPESWRFLYQLNPMTGVIESFRWALLGVGEPPGAPFAISVVCATVLMSAALFYFRSTERTIVDFA